MDRILQGIMRYRHTDRDTMVQQFLKVRDHPEPKAIFFTCMDSRMIPTRFTQTNVGDMFVVRNPGNVIPHSQHFLDEVTTNEPAALELACVMGGIRHVIVCGHSDCKAMNLLYALRDADCVCADSRRVSPLRSWLCSHAVSSLSKYRQLAAAGPRAPLLFQAETPMRTFVAYIDPEGTLAPEDRLSQVNCLQQLHNIASYGFLRSLLQRRLLHLHALWFDIYSGDVHYFSRRNKRYLPVSESTVDTLLEEVHSYCS